MIVQPLQRMGGTLMGADARRIDAVCSAFEDAWAEGRRPRIEDYLDEVGRPDRPKLLLELLLVELELRRRAGEGSGEAEYRARFPDDGALIERVFARAEGSTNTVEAIIPPGISTLVGPIGRRLPPPARRSDVTSRLHEGKCLGAYRILEYLGEGGMGQVYRAWDPPGRRLVALKVVRDDLGRDADAVRRFRREVEAIGNLAHPNIVRAYDTGEADGRP